MPNNTEEIISKTTQIDNYDNCELRQGIDGFYMLSPVTGNHFLSETTYTDRVRKHWSGFLINNGYENKVNHW